VSDDCGVCAGDVPPLIGTVLTGTGLTLDQAAARLERGEPLPALTDVQRRIVEAYAGTASLLEDEQVDLGARG
jgi:hypothetical protein